VGDVVLRRKADEAALVKAVQAFTKGSAPSEKERCVR